jgi:2-amino-4-hydroxy-6-hydroxymethyldihydropteridine diphosphokinase
VASLRDRVTAYVALGANLGDARQTILLAMDALALSPDMRVTGRSRLYRTAPHEAQGPDFINAVVQIDTCLTALDLLDALQAIENRAGRQRPYVNAPRTLDLDLLMYGQATVHSPRLTLPHPRWRERAFVLYPLADVLPGFVTSEDWAGVADQVIIVLDAVNE